MIISWRYCGHLNTLSIADKATATDLFLALRDCKGVTYLEGGYLTVEVVFDDYPKVYTYLTEETHSKGERLLVDTADGPKPVTVVNSCIKTRQQLERICPMSRYKTI